MKNKLLLLLLVFPLPILAGGEVQYKLGCDYFLKNNYNEAFYWYNEAAKEGNVDAIYSVGSCYFNGYGVPQNQKEAFAWYYKAAEKDYVLGQFIIAYCYYKGFGVKQDLKKAVQWYQKAAEQGLPAAQMSLAGCYYTGDGTQRDYNKAIFWWTKAAEQGNAESQYFLAESYDMGQIVPQNYDEAFKWYAKAAENGHTEAQYKLGLYYLEGKGVNQNKEQTVFWWLEASSQGHKIANADLQELKYMLGAEKPTLPPPLPADGIMEGSGIYLVVEQMPEFPSGQQAMMKFISENLEYPVAAQENGIEGRVVCSFVVNKDGSIVDVVTVRSSGDRYLDQEAIRVIQSMPKWTPGKQKGQPVRVKYTIPINFRLTDDKKQKPKE